MSRKHKKVVRRSQCGNRMPRRCSSVHRRDFTKSPRWVLTRRVEHVHEEEDSGEALRDPRDSIARLDVFACEHCRAFHSGCCMISERPAVSVHLSDPDSCFRLYWVLKYK